VGLELAEVAKSNGKNHGNGNGTGFILRHPVHERELGSGVLGGIKPDSVSLRVDSLKTAVE